MKVLDIVVSRTNPKREERLLDAQCEAKMQAHWSLNSAIRRCEYHALALLKQLNPELSNLEQAKEQRHIYAIALPKAIEVLNTLDQAIASLRSKKYVQDRAIQNYNPSTDTIWPT